MKHYKLDKEERQLLKEVEAGEWKRVDNLEKVKKDLKKVAANTLRLMKLGKVPSQ